MWLIKVQFKDGTWYRGICDKDNISQETAKKRLLMDFKEIHQSSDVAQRGGGLYHIWEDNRNYD